MATYSVDLENNRFQKITWTYLIMIKDVQAKK